jgi:hypothetical protein
MLLCLACVWKAIVRNRSSIPDWRFLVIVSVSRVKFYAEHLKWVSAVFLPVVISYLYISLPC